MKNAKVLKWFFGVLTMLSIIVVFWLNLLEQTQIVRAQERIRFVKLIENKDIRDKAMSGLYFGLKVDYCILKNHQKLLFLRYTLDWDLLDEIEVLFQKSLKEHPDWPKLDCEDRE